MRQVTTVTYDRVLSIMIALILAMSFTALGLGLAYS